MISVTRAFRRAANSGRCFPRRRPAIHRLSWRWLALAAQLSISTGPGFSQSGNGYDLTWSTIDSGGVAATQGNGYDLGATIGQPDAGVLTGTGGYQLHGGFWPVAAGVPLPCIADIDCVDFSTCTCNVCQDNECISLAGEYGNADCDGIVELGDVLCVLNGYADVAACPNGDLAPPCTGDDPPFIELSDVLAVLSAYSGDDPCGCEP